MVGQRPGLLRLPLAMFGPQEVPLGPHRMQTALPPHGCDPDAYQVRIKDTVVAILRGGGCSFGIKVINAQKLGAKAVIIVNTDESKNMRLMALPDEEPQIDIPCVMAAGASSTTWRGSSGASTPRTST